MGGTSRASPPGTDAAALPATPAWHLLSHGTNTHSQDSPKPDAHGVTFEFRPPQTSPPRGSRGEAATQADENCCIACSCVATQYPLPVVVFCCMR